MSRKKSPPCRSSTLKPKVETAIRKLLKASIAWKKFWVLGHACWRCFETTWKSTNVTTTWGELEGSFSSDGSKVSKSQPGNLDQFGNLKAFCIICHLFSQVISVIAFNKHEKKAGLLQQTAASGVLTSSADVIGVECQAVKCSTRSTVSNVL